MKASSRAFATAQAFFWALPLLAPFCIVFALLSYQFGLLGDDGGAAISVPTLLLSLISLITAIALTVKRRRAKPERIPKTSASRRLETVAMHLLGAVLTSAVELYVLLAMLFVRPAYVGFPLLIFGAILFFCCFTLFRSALLYEKAPKPRRSLVVHLMLICYFVFYLLTVKLLLANLAVCIGSGAITVEPWGIVCFLLCLIFAYLFRRIIAKSQ
ncbi:MAG: hypothetical protein E7620_07120 [Ruminococcaceae bacterium]|nr:hypothetical protein [Oscillospiraceae bacterium]